MDEDQLREKRELDALDLNKAMNNALDMNSKNSENDLITEKSIEKEYRCQPELPLL